MEDVKIAVVIPAFKVVDHIKDVISSLPREIDHINTIAWENFVAIGESCVLNNSSVPSKAIEELIAKANIRYYMNPARIADLLLHIRTSYEFSNYVKSGISLVSQILSWLKK